MVDANIIVAAITSTTSMAVAVTALLLNHRGFGAVERRLQLIEHGLDVLETDMKEFNKVQSRIEVEIARLKDKVGLE
jgi:hypothetical protein